MVSQWSFNESKSPQVFKTLLSIIIIIIPAGIPLYMFTQPCHHKQDVT